MIINNCTRPFLQKLNKSTGDLIHSSLQAFRFFHSATAVAALDPEAGDGASNPSRVDTAHKLFDENPKREISGYNHLLFEHSRNGLNHEAATVYVDINRNGVSVDGCTLSCMLKVSATICDRFLGKQLHCQCIKSGFFDDVSVGTSLVDMYIKAEELGNGRRIFYEMNEKNVVTWTSLITGYAQEGSVSRALETFALMGLEGIKPNPFTFATVLGALAADRSITTGSQIHGLVIKSGFESTSVVGNALVNLYSKCGMISEARDVFYTVDCVDSVSWNSMMTGLVVNGLELDALELFRRMRLSGVMFTETTFAVIINLCTNLKRLSLATQIHSRVVKTGFERFDNVRTALMVCYVRGNAMDGAFESFSSVKTVQSVVTWTAMIGGYLQSDRTSEAVDLFLEMRRGNVRPNHYTYSTVIPALTTGSVLQVHAEIIKTNYEHSSSVGTALLDAYIKSKSTAEAAKIFEKIKEKDVVAWSAMLTGYSQEGDSEGAVMFFTELSREGIEPNGYTFSTAINACTASTAATEQGKQFHAGSIKFGCSNNLIVSSALVTMYAKKGDIDCANRVFNRQKERDVYSWNSMITGYAQHGYARKALEVFEEMHERNSKMDEVTFVGVISACTRAGLVKEGEAYFDMMLKELRIDPTVEIYSCMVDLYSRAGMLKKAMALIDTMPFAPGATIWCTLLAACRVHKNIEIGKLAAENLISCHPQESAAYVLLANLYAASGHWRERQRVRNLMDERKVKKETGYSWIEVKSKTYSFVAGDVSHPLSQQIYAKLGEMSVRLRDFGYRPDTNCVLYDIEDEQKEAVLSRHSERLAIAFGLISVPGGVPIRVMKNLRVCGDCHVVIKLISEMEGREIVVRDSNRFHHFRDGSCSCGDYW